VAVRAQEHSDNAQAGSTTTATPQTLSLLEDSTLHLFLWNCQHVALRAGKT
jgi:hypothetical protein